MKNKQFAIFQHWQHWQIGKTDLHKPTVRIETVAKILNINATYPVCNVWMELLTLFFQSTVASSVLCSITNYLSYIQMLQKENEKILFDFFYFFYIAVVNAASVSFPNNEPSTLPAFNRLQNTNPASQGHRYTPYTLPGNSTYPDWQYSEPSGGIPYSTLMNPSNTARNRQIINNFSASASLSASKSFGILSIIANRDWRFLFTFAALIESNLSKKKENSWE